MANDTAIVDDVIIINAERLSSKQQDGDGVDEEDDCSICLEPFSSRDPPTVTKCKHEYHLHCILEWSQRSKECPICWQLLFLSDPSSQELLAAVESERAARSRRHIRQIHEVQEVNHVAPYIDDSDFEARIIQHLAAATSRARSLSRRRRQTYSEISPSQNLPSVSIADPSSLHHTNSTREYSDMDSVVSGGASPASATHSSSSSLSPSIMNGESSTINSRVCPVKPRILPSQPPSDNYRRSSELLALKESIRSKFSAASARCKESISKGTHGFKEKLLARNNTVKELSKEVQREMSAGIAGVSRMIDRLDLASRRTGKSGPLSTSNLADKGKGVQGSMIAQLSSGHTVESTHDSCPDIPPLISNTILGHSEAPLAQRRE